MTPHSTIFKAGLLCLGIAPSVVFAQSDVVPEKKQSTAPRLVVGAQAGASLSLANAYRYAPYQNNTGNFGTGSIGLYARKYIGDHLAIQAEVNFTGSGASNFHGPAYYLTPGYFTRRVTHTSYAVPVQLQYHLLNKESRIRPYFGVGGGVVRRNYSFTDNFSDPVNGIDETRRYTSRTGSAFLQLTQGVTWQLNDKWQLNQSFNFQHEMRDRRNNIGVQFGVGYKLR